MKFFYKRSLLPLTPHPPLLPPFLPLLPKKFIINIKIYDPKTLFTLYFLRNEMENKKQVKTNNFTFIHLMKLSDINNIVFFCNSVYLI